jgi:hypothetical protein
MWKALLSFCLVPAWVWAQSYTASVRGIVTDSTQAAVPGAKVVAVETARGLEHQATADAAGRYVLTPLPPGNYTLTVEAAGFRKHTHIATLGQVVENRFIVSTPILNRNPLSLVMLAPGVTPSNNSAGGVSNTNFVAKGTRNSPIAGSPTAPA